MKDLVCEGVSFRLCSATALAAEPDFGAFAYVPIRPPLSTTPPIQADLFPGDLSHRARAPPMVSERPVFCGTGVVPDESELTPG